ncbi:MAG: hypothetical protein H0U74_01670 [Bradymonadaceae bacterium]|nr:hypothetical protein [Lujinxingiaceae bacterium]
MSPIIYALSTTTDKDDPNSMRRTRTRRWRETRDTLPSRRKKRRSHRRDMPASRHYLPMVVGSDTALRGVQSRLAGGVVAALITLACIVFALTASAASMSITLAFSIGTCSLVAAVALLMSARREELVHQLATELGAPEPREQLELDGPKSLLLAQLEDGFTEHGSQLRAERKFFATPRATDGLP